MAAALGRNRYGRTPGASGCRNGHRERQLLGTFGPVSVSVPRARVAGAAGKQVEWHSKTLPAYKRVTKQAERLIAGTYFALMIAMAIDTFNFLAIPFLMLFVGGYYWAGVTTLWQEHQGRLRWQRERAREVERAASR